MAIFIRLRGQGRQIAARYARHGVARKVALLAVVACAWSFTWQSARAGTLVSMQTRFGTIQIDLFGDLVPETVNNFLSYVNSGAYNGTAVHRTDTGLGVIQGGGYTFNSGAGRLDHIPTNDPVVLQVIRPNTRGTISMARTSAPNSATSEWFINTVDNSETLGPGNNGGFAVFGWIVGKGMDAVDTIHSQPITAIPGQIQGSPVNLTTVPVVDFTPGNQVQESNLVLTNVVSVVGQHPSYQNPVLRGDVNNDGEVRVGDVQASITDFLSNGARDLTEAFAGTNYVDVTGDDRVSVRDIHNAITAFLTRDLPAAAPAAAPLAAPLSASQFATVPEPTSLSLAAVAGLAVTGAWLWRRRRGWLMRG